MVILSLLSSGNGSLCPTTVLQEEKERGMWSQKLEKNIKCNKNVDILFHKRSTEANMPSLCSGVKKPAVCLYQQS